MRGTARHESSAARYRVVLAARGAQMRSRLSLLWSETKGKTKVRARRVINEIGRRAPKSLIMQASALADAK